MSFAQFSGFWLKLIKTGVLRHLDEDCARNLLPENVYANNIHMNSTQKSANENIELNTTTNISGAKSNHALNSYTSSLISEDITGNELPETVLTQTARRADEIAGSESVEATDLFNYLFDQMPAACLEGLILLFQTSKKEQSKKTIDFIFQLVQSGNMLWVYMGIAAYWKTFNTGKNKGGRTKKSPPESGHMNAIKQIVEIINRKVPELITVNTLYGYKRTLEKFKRDELEEIFTTMKTISATETVLWEQISVKLQAIILDMTKLEMTFYKVAADTDDPAEAIKIAIEKTASDAAYTSDKFKHYLGLSKKQSQKSDENLEKQKVLPPRENTFAFGDMDKENKNSLLSIMRQLKITDPQIGLRICFRIVKKFYGAFPEVTLLDADENINALKP